ncbi:MAG: glycoside hydrolase family 3 N-terminal domain-containing protein [Gaiellaceae bacterium]
MSEVTSDLRRRSDDGVVFRDLNKNGRLDPYEDPRLPVAERVDDLLRRLTPEEKVGLMFHQVAGIDEHGYYGDEHTRDFLLNRLINHFNVYQLPEPRAAGEWHNELQRLAEQTRLGIPVTVSSDPRHAFTANPATSMAAGHLSQWPEPIGLAAARDEALVHEFADIARQEYLALGIRLALHPQADLATEPRWARIHGTFGEDAELASRLVRAYIRGFQGETLGRESVACITKHFPGGGPQKDGEDPHFSYGREQIYPGGRFDYHLLPFEAALAAGTAQVMPYYGMPVGTEYAQVGFAFNKGVIEGLLRGRYGFDGVVCSDWTVLQDVHLPPPAGETIEARAWGLEHATVAERIVRALDAGIDQFGGESCTEVLRELVSQGRVPESRLDVSVRRILRDKFRLGLFDDPFVDPEAAAEIVGNPRFRAAGAAAQRRAIVLLANRGGLLPLRGRPRLYVSGLDPEAARAYADVVPEPELADLVLLRLRAPYESRPGFLQSIFHAGDLDFKGEEKERILDLLRRRPTIVDIFLDRPAVIPEIAAESAALLASFGASDDAVLDVVFGRFEPSGRLPFELPSSMEAVRAQQPDVPFDSRNPLFPFGFGLGY